MRKFLVILTIIFSLNFNSAEAAGGSFLKALIQLFKGSGKVDMLAEHTGARFLYCEGEPINEPVARMGPFVMNTQSELMQAVEDYNSGRLAN